MGLFDGQVTDASNAAIGQFNAAIPGLANSAGQAAQQQIPGIVNAAGNAGLPLAHEAGRQAAAGAKEGATGDIPWMYIGGGAAALALIGLAVWKMPAKPFYGMIANEHNWTKLPDDRYSIDMPPNESGVSHKLYVFRIFHDYIPTLMVKRMHDSEWSNVGLWWITGKRLLFASPKEAMTFAEQAWEQRP